MSGDEKDVPQFKAEKCPKCVAHGYCDNKDNHWFLMCPHYFNWKLGLPTSFVTQQLEYQRTHPEEMAEKKKKNTELAKKIKITKKSQKKDEKK